MTFEDFNKLEENHKEAKEALDTSLSQLLLDMPNPTREIINASKNKGSKFFSEFESFIASASSEDNTLSKMQINDILNSIENILEFSITYWDTMQNVSNDVLEDTFNPQHNFLKTSQGVLKTYRKEQALLLQNKFKNNNLPIQGFLSKEKYKLNSSNIDWLSITMGIVLLIITSILIFIIQLNTGMQYWITRILGSLGVAFLITGIAKDTIQAKINLPTSVITATGAIAIFFMLYFSNPAEAPKYNSTAHQE